MNLNLTLSYVLTTQDVEDVLYTALNGGSNYWLHDADEITVGKSSFKFKHTFESDEPREYVVDPDGIRRAAQFVLNQPPGPAYERDQLVALIKDDCVGAADAELADVLVQLAAFDDVVFG